VFACSSERLRGVGAIVVLLDVIVDVVRVVGVIDLWHPWRITYAAVALMRMLAGSSNVLLMGG